MSEYRKGEHKVRPSSLLTGDLKSAKLIYLKAVLFLIYAWQQRRTRKRE